MKILKKIHKPKKSKNSIKNNHSLMQVSFYLILSALAVLFSPYLRLGVQYIHHFYQHIHNSLAFLIEQPWLLNVLILFCVPLIIAGVPALLYKSIKKTSMPYFLELTWLLWIIFFLSHLMVQ